MVEALRERAELYLLRQLRWGQRRPRRREDSPAWMRETRDEQVARFGEQIEALRVVGALTEEEARTWVTRVESELDVAVDRPVAAAETPDAARRLLEELPAQARAGAVAARPDAVIARRLSTRCSR